MPPPCRLRPYLGLLIPGFGLMIPMFTQLHQKFPCLGPIYRYGLALGAVLGIACAA